MTSPNYTFMRLRLYSKPKVKYNKSIYKLQLTSESDSDIGDYDATLPMIHISGPEDETPDARKVRPKITRKDMTVNCHIKDQTSLK